MKTILATLAFSISAFSQTQVLFSSDPAGSLTTGPFPSNALVAPDGRQLTGVRINLPSSPGLDACDGTQIGAVCGYSGALNQLDGFSIEPRSMVCFSAAVDAASLQAAMQFVSVSSGAATSVNRVLLDPKTNCAFAKPVQVLDQQSQYLLVVRKSVQDAAHKTVSTSPEFIACAGTSTGVGYCPQLNSALSRAGVRASDLLIASFFTTMSTTRWMEGARNFVSRLSPLNFPAGESSYFRLKEIQSLWYQPAKTVVGTQPVPIGSLDGVNAVFFGWFSSPSYINPGGIAPGTITTTPDAPLAWAPVSYHIFLPKKHGKNIPVVIYAHGSGDNQFGASTAMASTLAQNGFATLAFELFGHGYGLTSTASVVTKHGTFTEWVPGRGVLLPGKTSIGPMDGCIAPGPFGVRDCLRQSAVDLITLVQNIVKTNGLGLDLDAQRIYVVGQSLGAFLSSDALPVEPALKAAVMNGLGDSSINVVRLAASRLLAENYLQTLNPFLLNVVTQHAPLEPYYKDAFNDDFTFVNDPARTSSVPGALTLQAAFETADWLNKLADPVSFAPYFHLKPLPGVPAKPALFQFGTGDLEVPNPTESAVVLAAGGQSAATILDFAKAVSLRPELAWIGDPNYPGALILPHRVLSNPTIFSYPSEQSLALALQQQAAKFFETGGSQIPDANQYVTDPFSPADLLFVSGPLPTGLNFVQIQP